MSKKCGVGMRGSWRVFHASAPPFHWNHRCFKGLKWSNIRCKVVRTFEIPAHFPCSSYQTAKLYYGFYDNMSLQHSNNRIQTLTLKFSTICSSLFLIRKSGFSMAFEERLLKYFFLLVKILLKLRWIYVLWRSPPQGPLSPAPLGIANLGCGGSLLTSPSYPSWKVPRTP